MNGKFKVWDSKNKDWADKEIFLIRGDGVLLRFGGGSHPFTAESYFTPVFYTRRADKNGIEIYESDIVYLAGIGNVVMEFPFLDLYEAAAEKDIGEITGNDLVEGKLCHKPNE